MKTIQDENSIYIYGYLFTILLGSLHYGYNISVFAVYQDMFMQMYNWEDDDDMENLWSSIMTTLNPLGAAITSLTSFLVMKHSRRLTMYLAGTLTLIGVLFMSIIHNPDGENKATSLTFFCIGRLFMGFGVGYYSSVSPTYINEIAPRRLTGTFGSCHQLCITIALLITGIIGITLPDLTNEEVRDHITWRLGYGVPLVFSLLQVILITIVYKNESPAFYINKNDEESAMRALKSMYNTEEAARMAYDEAIEIKNKAVEGTITGSLYETYKKAFWIGMGIATAQQFTGINTIMFYAPTMFDNQGDAKTTLNFVVTVTQFVFTLTSVYTSDKFGRRVLFIIGTIGCAIGLLLATIGYSDDEDAGMNASSWIFDIGVFVFIAAFGMSHGPIGWLYMSEILLSQWLGYAAALTWLFTIIVGLITPYALSGIGRWIFFIFLIAMIATIFFIVFCLIETKGKTRDEIMAVFAKKIDMKVVPDTEVIPSVSKLRNDE